MLGYIALALYAATIPAANWMIVNIGYCGPDGPCVLPVGFGLMAPSGVLMIGASLVLRDAVHNALGWKWAISAIFLGAMLSFAFSPSELVIASVAAFVVSELSDFAVYAPLRNKRLVLAVVASGLIGSTIDSAVFLMMAFGSLDLISGQIVGKFWVTAIAAIFMISIRKMEAA